jgi:hypothetical protein
MSHIEQQLSRAEVRLDPFPHIYVPDIFPLATYRAMWRSLPTDEGIATCPPSSPPDTSRYFSLEAQPMHHGNVLDDIERDWRERFLDPITELDGALVSKFRPHIDAYLSGAAAEVRRGQTLFCFRPSGWKIKPHTHPLPQILQTMVYFPGESYSASQGTYLYKLPRWRTLDRERQKEAVVYSLPPLRRKLVPYAHNALVAWLNTPRALHGTVERRGAPSRRYIFLCHVTDTQHFE